MPGGPEAKGLTMTRLTIRIDFDDERQIGHGKIRLIEAIGAHGSISAAARAIGMSYRRAWLLLDEVNRMFATPVVDARMGGKGGGAAALTPLGHELVTLYRGIETSAGVEYSARLASLTEHLSTPPSGRA
jgi:molybdate transport system regulatory protein